MNISKALQPASNVQGDRSVQDKKLKYLGQSRMQRRSQSWGVKWQIIPLHSLAIRCAQQGWTTGQMIFETHIIGGIKSGLHFTQSEINNEFQWKKWVYTPAATMSSWNISGSLFFCSSATLFSLCKKYTGCFIICKFPFSARLIIS